MLIVYIKNYNINIYIASRFRIIYNHISQWGSLKKHIENHVLWFIIYTFHWGCLILKPKVLYVWGTATKEPDKLSYTEASLCIFW